MGKHKLILNPAAGRGQGARIQAKVMAALAAHSLDCDVALTQKPGDAVTLARDACDTHEVVVAVGGDGTIHEIVNGLMQAANGGVTTPLGIIPVGTGDDLANSLGLAHDSVDAAVARLARGQPRLIDVGRVNDEYFDNEVAVAFSAQTLIESKKITAPLGPLLYFMAIFRTLVSYNQPRLQVRWEGGEMDRDMLLVAVGNGRTTGGGIKIAPIADLQDGLFDITIADKLSRLGILQLLPKVMVGKHVGEKPVTVARSPWVTIDSPGGFPLHADGELLGASLTHAEIEILPRRLNVLV